MTDQELAAAVTEVTEWERRTRAVWGNESALVAERESALTALRLVVPLRRVLEAWVVMRACRVAQTTT